MAFASKKTARKRLVFLHDRRCDLFGGRRRLFLDLSRLRIVHFPGVIRIERGLVPVYLRGTSEFLVFGFTIVIDRDVNIFGIGLVYVERGEIRSESPEDRFRCDSAPDGRFAYDGPVLDGLEFHAVRWPVLGNGAVLAVLAEQGAVSVNLVAFAIGRVQVCTAQVTPAKRERDDRNGGDCSDTHASILETVTDFEVEQEALEELVGFGRQRGAVVIVVVPLLLGNFVLGLG